MEQNCASLEEIILGCARNSGGILRIYAGDQEDVTAITEDTTAWSVTAMTVLVAPIEIGVKRKTSFFTEDEQQDLTEGSVVVTQTITAKLHRRDADKSRALNVLGSGQRYLYVIVKDMNNKFWYFPYTQLQSTGEGSGQQRADGSKYSVVLVAEDDHLAYEIDETVVNSILAVS